MVVYSKQTSPVPIHRMESADKPLLSPLEQMNTNRKTIAELITPNLLEAQVRKLLYSSCYLLLIYKRFHIM